MRKLATILIAAVWLAGCASSGSQGTSKSKSAAPGKASSQSAGVVKAVAKPGDAKKSLIKEMTADLEFFDSYSFDTDLSDTMRDRYRDIDVNAPSSFSLNEIPDRMDKWLYRIKDSGGKVKARALPPKDQVAMRGVIGALIDVIISIFSAIEEKALYGPAENYNATLFYRKETGMVEKVVFSHR